jgi:hypothetical protein
MPTWPLLRKAPGLRSMSFLKPSSSAAAVALFRELGATFWEQRAEAELEKHR